MIQNIFNISMGRKNKIRTTKASLVTDDFVETQIITSLMMTRYGIVLNVKGWNEKNIS